jgi:beta-lactamase class A
MRRALTVLLLLLVLCLLVGNPGVVRSETSKPNNSNESLAQRVADSSTLADASQGTDIQPGPATAQFSQSDREESVGFVESDVDGTKLDFERVTTIRVDGERLQRVYPIYYYQVYKVIIDSLLPSTTRAEPILDRLDPSNLAVFFTREMNLSDVAVCAPKLPIVPTLVAENETSQAVMEALYQTVEQVVAPLCGDYAVYFRELQGNNIFSINGQVGMRAASFVKMPTLVALYREAEAGRISLDTIYRLESDDKRGGAGSLFEQPAGFEITYRELARLMGQESDNTAFNVLAYKVLGSEVVQQTINLLGMTQTFFEDRTTTPEDMATFFRKLYSENVVSEQSRDEILSFITHTVSEDRIPAGIPEGITVAHKIGSSTGVISDAGIVFSNKPFILVIMTQDANEFEALEALPEISRIVYGLWEQ